MSMEQETLIYVEENDKEEAKILTKGLLNKEVQSRAFFNALGAELGLKYLALENISNSKTYNLHNVHKLLEEFDISDIMLTNIHIDVRVVFNENQIFIPKSHFEYDILPDIYFVFLLAEDRSHVKFLGFFEPKLINKNNQNADYYFIEKEKLTSPLNLKEYIESFKGNTTQTLSDDINETAETLMVSLVDQNASKEEVKELLKYLTKSSQLRDRFIEFENFEILSYKAERSPDVTIPEEVAKENIIDATIDDLRAPAEEIPSESVSQEPETEQKEQQTEDTPSISAGEIAEGAVMAAGALAAAETLGETAVESLAAAAEVTEDAAQDVTDMFTNDSMSVMQEGINHESEPLIQEGEVILDPPPALSIEEVDINPLDTTGEEAPASPETAVNELPPAEEVQPVAAESVETSAPIEQTVQEEAVQQQTDTQVNTIQDEPTAEEVSHDFVESDTDDFFAGMNFDEPLSEESGDDSLSADASSDLQVMNEEKDNAETVDFGNVDQSFVQPQVDVSSDGEMEVLDISNVTAVPNNLDQNISETIEFNNIELSHEKPCFNELNGEETVPMLNMNDFTPLEPLPMDNYNAESYDMDSLSITDNMLPMPKLEQTEETFEAVDMDSLNINSGMVSAAKAAAEQNVQEKDDSAVEELSAELDSIPDFDGDMDIGLSEEDGTDSLDAVNSVNTTAEVSSADQNEAIQNLTEDDIVEQTAENDSDEVPVTDMESLVPVDELAHAESESNAIPSIDETLENPEIANETEDNTDDSEDFINDAELVTEEQPQEEQANQDKDADGSDITMLFNDSSNEIGSEIEDFHNLDEMNQIPSIYQNNQKLPVKMFAVAAVAAVLVVGGLVGFSMKNKNAVSEPEPLAQTVPEELPAGEKPADAEKADSAPIVDNADILANTPEVQTLPAPQKEPVNVKKDAPEAKTANAASKPLSTPVSYTGVSKLSWEVPDYLSYSDNIKKYLQTAGKSIKLTLSSDLLLVNEYAYSNQMKVDMKLSSDGTLKASNIVKSSGSSQIDKIVLQTVKDTLNVIKPAAGEVPTPDFRLALIINF